MENPENVTPSVESKVIRVESKVEFAEAPAVPPAGEFGHNGLNLEERSHVTTVSFKHKVPGGPTQLCEAVFVPRGKQLPPARVREIVEKAWEKPMPNLLVHCQDQCRACE